MNVTVWNTYNASEDKGRKVISTEVAAETITDAMDQVEVMARNFNAECVSENMKANFITCGGFIRAL